MTLDANLHCTKIASLIIHSAFRILTPLTSLYRRHIQNAIIENSQTGVPTVMTFAKVETPKAPCRARPRKERSRQETTSDSEEDRRSSTKITRTENKGEDFSPEIRRISDLAEVFEAIESSKQRIGIKCRNRTTRIQPAHGHPRTGGGGQATNKSRE